MTPSPTAIYDLALVFIQLESENFALTPFENGSLVPIPASFSKSCLDFHDLVTLGAEFLFYKVESITIASEKL